MKQAIVSSYNQHMGGADRVHQQLHGMHILRKHNKWYKMFVFRLLSQCMLNSYRICEKKTRQKKIIIFQLITLKHEALFPRELVVDDRVCRLSGRHFLSSKLPQPGAVDKQQSKACQVCSAKGKRTNRSGYLKTTFVCTFCPSEPGLHPDKCFEEYHTKLDYSH